MKTKHSRREFLKLSSTGVLGAMILPNTNWNMPDPLVSMKRKDKLKIGLQLYTIRDAITNDLEGSLKKVAEIGYKNLELANYNDGKFYGHTPEEFKKMVNDLGMNVISSHVGVPKGITDDAAKKIAADHKAVGAKYCMQPYVADADRKTVEGYKKMVADWNKVGRIMKDSGIQFGYHNHNFEFDTVEGKVPYFDIFLPEMDKDLTFELDLFWTTKAGIDPVDLFNKYPGRFQLFHMKDMHTKEQPFFKTASDDFAPVGEGVIDFNRILDARKTAGLKYMFVEQDNAGKGDAFESIRKSYVNLTTKILA